jgi:Raf kinase inhibitor-like YbhB/YbcL family protein
MNFKIWIILLIVAILGIFLFSKILIKNNESNNIKNINSGGYMKIESDVFVNNNKIPVEYTCNGKGARPTLKISDVPKSAKSLALIVDDPDAPNGDFVHFVVWNIDPDTSIIENDSLPSGAEVGYTSLDKPGWIAPCPPSGIHHYNFKLYALDILLSIPKSSTKADLIQIMDKHIIDEAILVGLYGRE